MSTSPEVLLCDYLTACARTSLSEDVADMAVHFLVDAMTLSRAAADHPVVKAVETLLAENTNALLAARCWTTGKSYAVLDAILLSATATHAFFQDDTDMTAWAHPGSLIPAVAFCLAEAEGLGVEQALRGLVAGYATLNWLGAEEEVARQVVEGGFRASSTFGPICAAAAAAATLSLSSEQTLNAISLAACGTGGILEPVRSGAQDWRLQNGFAAQRGATVALLARAGVVGSPTPLTGKGGFLNTFTKGAVPQAWRQAPSNDALKRVWFKPYPTLGDNMAPAVAAARLSSQCPASASINRIDIHMNAHFAAYPGTQYVGPFERTEQMITSTAFAVSALLLNGDLDYADYAVLRTDQGVLDLVQKCRIIPVEGMDYLDGTVEVHAEDKVITGKASECPRALFFRGRKETRAVVENRISASSQLDQILFAGLVGDAATFDQVHSELSAG